MNQSFAASVNFAAGGTYLALENPSASNLPEVPQDLIGRLFRHLNAKELATALQQRLVPIAWLPHMTLYADASRQPRAPNNSIVATILPQDFEAAVARHLRKGLIAKATDGLRRNAPVFSAHHRLSFGQKLTSFLLIIILMGLFVLVPPDILYLAICIIFSCFFLSMIWLRLLAIAEPAQNKVSQPEMRNTKLPVYTVLVPVFQEVSLLQGLLVALSAIDYPREKLDIKLVLEESDTTMQRALSKIKLPSFIEAIIVPCGKPQTKPRALNYALQFARGSLVTIYDAEDIPEPMQLRQAAARFAQSPENVACLQAELAFYNANENWLTRQFAVEYATLFKLILPALANNKLPMPLGGTSNHFRTQLLRDVGAWDPYNVTEDADLGFRLMRLGYEVQILNSITYEEANTTLPNWLHQRARWLKGFLMTWLVHMRHPVALYRELGLSGFIALQASTLGVFVSATLHPIFLGLTIYHIFFFNPHVTKINMLSLVLDCFFMGLMITGSLIVMTSGLLALLRKQFGIWPLTLATMPAYWFLASLAGWIALWQFIRAPYHWNKTRHGLTRFVRRDTQILNC